MADSKPSYWTPGPWLKLKGDKAPKSKKPRVIISKGNEPPPQELLRIDHPGDYGGLILQVHHDPDSMSGAKVVVGRVQPHVYPAPPTQGFPLGIPNAARGGVMRLADLARPMMVSGTIRFNQPQQQLRQPGMMERMLRGNQQWGEGRGGISRYWAGSPGGISMGTTELAQMSDDYAKDTEQYVDSLRGDAEDVRDSGYSCGGTVPSYMYPHRARSGRNVSRVPSDPYAEEPANTPDRPLPHSNQHPLPASAGPKIGPQPKTAGARLGKSTFGRPKRENRPISRTPARGCAPH